MVLRTLKTMLVKFALVTEYYIRSYKNDVNTADRVITNCFLWWYFLVGRAERTLNINRRLMISTRDRNFRVATHHTTLKFRLRILFFFFFFRKTRIILNKTYTGFSLVITSSDVYYARFTYNLLQDRSRETHDFQICITIRKYLAERNFVCVQNKTHYTTQSK